MSTSPNNIGDIAKAIQLALAPVFLLTGIAGILNVMSGRLSRIIDRGRVLTEGVNAHTILNQEDVQRELKQLEQRRNFTSLAITFSTVAALLVCLVIVILFIEVMSNIVLEWFVGGLFIISTLTLVIGLAYFLREVHMSSRTIRFVGFKKG